jgi:hypothetical protein
MLMLQLMTTKVGSWLLKIAAEGFRQYVLWLFVQLIALHAALVKLVAMFGEWRSQGLFRFTAATVVNCAAEWTVWQECSWTILSKSPMSGFHVASGKPKTLDMLWIHQATAAKVQKEMGWSHGGETERSATEANKIAEEEDQVAEAKIADCDSDSHVGR